MFLTSKTDAALILEIIAVENNTKIKIINNCLLQKRRTDCLNFINIIYPEDTIVEE
jgi:hypothetical protein